MATGTRKGMKMVDNKSGSYFTREESFMYDKETKFPLEATSNAARVEYLRNGLTFMESRRCHITRISRSSAIVEFSVDSEVPSEMTLDIPDARVSKVGCVKLSERRSRVGDAKLTVTLRLLRLLTEAELENIKRYGNTAVSSRRPNVAL